MPHRLCFCLMVLASLGWGSPAAGQLEATTSSLIPRHSASGSAPASGMVQLHHGRLPPPRFVTQRPGLGEWFWMSMGILSFLLAVAGLWLLFRRIPPKETPIPTRYDPYG